MAADSFAAYAMQCTKLNQECVDNLTKGSTVAFDILYNHYHQAVFANISKFIRQQDIAEDVLQDVFMSLWENRKQMDPLKDVGGWLFVVSYNKSIATLKRKVKENLVFTDDISQIIIKDEQQANEVEELKLDLLTDAISALSPRKKRVFELCRLQGKTYAEAAAILSVSIETVKDYLKDSLKFVREFIFSKTTGSTLLTIVYLSQYLQL